MHFVILYMSNEQFNNILFLMLVAITKIIHLDTFTSALDVVILFEFGHI